jgi:hypothetical protein
MATATALPTTTTPRQRQRHSPLPTTTTPRQRHYTTHRKAHTCVARQRPSPKNTREDNPTAHGRRTPSHRLTEHPKERPLRPRTVPRSDVAVLLTSGMSQYALDPPPLHTGFSMSSVPTCFECVLTTTDGRSPAFAHSTVSSPDTCSYTGVCPTVYKCMSNGT